MNQTFSLPANGNPVTFILGNFAYFYLRSATNPIQISYDGTTWTPVLLNDIKGPISPAPTRIYLAALNGAASTGSFDYSAQPFNGQSTSQKVASTYCVGTTYNLANTTTRQIIPIGILNGNQRKGIFFNVPAASNAASVDIFDSTGTNWLASIVKNNPPTYLETDDGFAASTSPGQTHNDSILTVGEIYFRN